MLFSPNIRNLRTAQVSGIVKAHKVVTQETKLSKFYFQSGYSYSKSNYSPFQSANLYHGVFYHYHDHYHFTCKVKEEIVYPKLS